jgi:hypothetical protein
LFVGVDGDTVGDIAIATVVVLALALALADSLW